MGLFKKPSKEVNEARAKLKKSEEPTYNSKKIAQVVVAKNKQLKDELNSTAHPKLNFILLRPLIVFALKKDRKLGVLDLGGGGGTHYLVARKCISSEVELQWAVVETPAMVTEAQCLSNSELSFFESLDSAAKHLDTIDIAIASGVFPYFEDPLRALSEFLDVGAEFILITRTALSNSTEALKEIQTSRLKDNGPGDLPAGFEDEEIRYPATIVSKIAFKNILERDYEIICEIEEDKSVHRIGQVTIDQYGFLCRKK
jgi:putative methyltransferase (TIGR04325 family)